MSDIVYIPHSSNVQVVVTSFGYLHGTPDRADIIVDVRQHLRDPHIDPTFQQLNGHDSVVVERVLSTPGANRLVDALVAAASALLPVANSTGRLVTVAIGCAGGRHRSVVLADAVAARLALAGWGTEAEHLHINRDVVQR